MTRSFIRSPLMTFVFWLVLSFMTLFPVWWMFLVSVRQRVDLFGTPSFLLDVSRMTWGNYQAVLSNPTFQKYMINSLIVSTSNAVLVSVLGLLAAYAMSRYKLVGKDNIFFWVLTNRMAPPAVFLLPLFLMFTLWFRVGDWSLFDTRLGLVLLYCVFNLPFAFWLLQGIVDGIPRELDEAAYVDGASTFTVLTTIIFPLAKPGLAVTAILTWVFAWNEYLFASTLTSVDARTITTGLAEFVTVTGTNWGQLAAVAMLTLLPAALVLALVQRHIVAGLTFGAVKG
ncbi:carbohydrate ABC transporter permease [Thalassospira alkalitolerans]|uniref:Maltose/maltodextrin transport system permease protein MalG n=1 Tax=Thalassospira alkalitolerans TaxID=1293890 RepID=A0A1Y2LEJ9_9PROT|nr:carbohydrate ABC transporter permease [Thalassospira alkalitolerans]OSQ49431.1 sugar ABC transporter [Thalassospira alkalitolerans]|tara:strand:- start:280756 stop:281607 length:852 start_codon:yes stop_codon:yes gene_type:complete